MLTEEHLRSLSTYLMASASDLEKRIKDSDTHSPIPADLEADPTEAIHEMKKLSRQIEVLDYNPVLFGGMLEEYDMNIGPLDKPLESVPLYINDENPVALVIVKWRLENAV